MNRHELLHVYATDERLKSIAERLNPSAPLLTEGDGNPLRIRLEGLIGASSSVVAAAFYQLLQSSSAIAGDDAGDSSGTTMRPLRPYAGGLLRSDEKSELSMTRNFSMLFVLNDKEEAAYFQNDIQHFIEKKEVQLLVDSFRKPGNFDELNNSNVQLRTEVINRI